MRITEAGNVGIGTTAPQWRLQATNTSIANGSFGIVGGFSGGDDGTLGPVNVVIGAYPSATGSARYGAMYVGDANALRPLVLNYWNGVSGNVGIGTTSPTAPLHVKGIGNGIPLKLESDQTYVDLQFVNSGNSNGLIAYDNNGAMFFYANSVATPTLTIAGGAPGSVGIGNTSPSVALDVTGSIEYTGTIADVSDRRMKSNIAPLSGQLNNIATLRPVSFTMKDDPKGRTEFGFIAQDVEPVFPELVGTGSDGTKSLNYVGMIAPLVQAVQEQQRQIEALKGEVETLKAQRRSAGPRYNQ